GVHFFPVVLFLISIWTAEFFGVMGKALPGNKRRYETIAGGKPDRAFWTGLMALILYFYPKFIHYTSHYFYFMSFLVILTGLRRVKNILRISRGKDYRSYTFSGR
ncbi:MAG: hypothetical protein ACOCWO_05150, partial [Candidatus Muiribacteriaceae bacterium]